MQDNFNLKGYLRNNKLLNEGIGGYFDLKPLKEYGDDPRMDLDSASDDHLNDIHNLLMDIDPKISEWFADYQSELEKKYSKDLEKDPEIAVTFIEDWYENRKKLGMPDKGINELGNSGYDSDAANWEWNREEAEESAALYKAAREKEAAEKDKAKDQDEKMNELNDLGNMEEEQDSFIQANRDAVGKKGSQIFDDGWQDDGDDEDFVDGYQETQDNAKSNFQSAINSLRQMDFSDRDIIDLFKNAFSGK